MLQFRKVVLPFIGVRNYQTWRFLIQLMFCVYRCTVAVKLYDQEESTPAIEVKWKDTSSVIIIVNTLLIKTIPLSLRNTKCRKRSHQNYSHLDHFMTDKWIIFIVTFQRAVYTCLAVKSKQVLILCYSMIFLAFVGHGRFYCMMFDAWHSNALSPLSQAQCGHTVLQTSTSQTFQGPRPTASRPSICSPSGVSRLSLSCWRSSCCAVVWAGWLFAVASVEASKDSNHDYY